MQQVFTTGQVARLCRVAPRTVCKWFDSGRLRGYRLPGSNDRRFPREALIQFLKANGFPGLAELEAEAKYKILLIGAAQRTVLGLQQLLPETEGYHFAVAASGFEAGLLAEESHPNAIIVDLALGRSEALQIAQHLQRHPRHEHTPLIALADEDEAQPGTLTSWGFWTVLQKPFDVALLAEQIKSYRNEQA